MPISLAGKPIVITGAGSGIGRATALACAAAGMPVVLTGRRREPLDAAVRAIEGAGGRAAALAGDVTDQAHCDAAVAMCLERFGSIYSVFANAGYGVECATHEMADADMRAIFETNIFGTLNILRPALPLMRAAKAGHALICSSCLGLMPLPYYGAYCATKAAQHHVSRAMGVELRGTGVRVSSVHPVGTRTEFFDTADRRSPRSAGLMRVGASDRFLQPPERVARAVVRCLRRPRPEVWTSGAARLGFGLAAMFPGATDRLLARVLARRLRAVAGNPDAGKTRNM
jgi:NAD(P)-dependent dehydrogenase (short-subunit alcohol dehydrogenase family)